MYTPVQTNEMATGEKVKNMVWGMINSTLLRFAPPQLAIFRKWRVVWLRLFGAKVDWSASVHPRAKIEYPWNLTMGRQSSIGERAWVYAMAPISIGENTCVGKETYLITGSHDIGSNRFELITKPITIGSGCWLTTGVTVLQGVTIGDYAVVAANATVVKDVEAWTVVGGNPARFIKKRVIEDEKYIRNSQKGI